MSLQRFLSKITLLTLLLATTVTAKPAYQLVPAPLNLTAVNAFLTCVNATNTPYQLLVEADGTTTLYPPTPRLTDFTTTDLGLLQCMKKSCSCLQISARSSLYITPHETRRSIDVALADYTYLSAHRAVSLTAKPFKGKRSTANRVAATRSSKRDGTPEDAAPYFNFFGDEDRGCHSHDLIHSYEDHCYDHRTAYKSVFVENTESHDDLHWTIWPHHQCMKDDSHTYLINPGFLSSCKNYDTFSYKGHYS